MFEKIVDGPLLELTVARDFCTKGQHWFSAHVCLCVRTVVFLSRGHERRGMAFLSVKRMFLAHPYKSATFSAQCRAGLIVLKPVPRPDPTLTHDIHPLLDYHHAHNADSPTQHRKAHAPGVYSGMLSWPHQSDDMCRCHHCHTARMPREHLCTAVMWHHPHGNTVIGEMPHTAAAAGKQAWSQHLCGAPCPHVPRTLSLPLSLSLSCR